MPAPIYYSHRLMEKQAEILKQGNESWLRPDAKSQVTFVYKDGSCVSIDTIVSTQHDESITLEKNLLLKK